MIGLEEGMGKEGKSVTSSESQKSGVSTWKRDQTLVARFGGKVGSAHLPVISVLDTLSGTHSHDAQSSHHSLLSYSFHLTSNCYLSSTFKLYNKQNIYWAAYKDHKNRVYITR